MSTISVTQPKARRTGHTDRWLFFALGALILAIVGIGYGPAIFVAGLVRPEVQSVIIRIHVVLVSLWLCSFAAQVLFAIAGKLVWHRRFGTWAFAVAAVWAFSALAALAVDLHLEPQYDAEGFILVTRITIFAGFLAMAWIQRTRPPAHKRWMVLAMSQAIIGGIRSLPIPWLHENTLHATETALAFPLALIVYDFVKNRRLEPATLWGSAIIFAVQLIRFPVANSHAWLAMARWVGSLNL
jgi:hypothetical protein